MSKIDITSKEWCDIIFDGKNKDYGAYRIRVESKCRYMFVLVLLVVLSSVPFLYMFLYDAFSCTKVKKIDIVQLSDMKPAENKYRLVVRSVNIASQKRKVASKQQPKSDVLLIKPDKEVKNDNLSSSDEKGTNANISLTDIPADTSGFSNKTVARNAVNANKDKVIFRVVEQLPEFPGGATAYMKWLTKNLRYPITAQQQKVNGKVVVQFVVNKNGSVSDIKILEPLDPDCDKEVVRVLSMMPKWKPGMEKDHPVRTKYVIPIVFKMV